MSTEEVRAGGSGREGASAEIYGREAEVAAVHAFVEASGAPRALLLEGEAGIGKTTLWWNGVARATQLGHHVLQARPAEGEAALAFAGLGDLRAAGHRCCGRGDRAGRAHWGFDFCCSGQQIAAAGRESCAGLSTPPHAG